MKKLVAQPLAGLLLLLAALALPSAADAQALPTPGQFVRNLDVRCYKIPNQPPLNVNLRLDHLNPVLINQGLPPEFITLFEPQELCVPVQKDQQVPPPDVLPFIRYVDLKCYRIAGPPVIGGDINLTHLNPLFTNTTPELVKFVQQAPRQLCVPVAKNQQIPPPEVLPIIRFSDVLCYDILGAPLNMQLALTHLNPVLRNMGLPVENVPVTDTTKLCVPVAKNGMFPPG